MVYRFITVNVIVYGKSIIVYHCHKPMGFCICLAYFSLSMSLSMVFSWLLVYHCHGLWWSFGHCASTCWCEFFPPSASEIARNFDRVCWRRTWAPADKVARAVDHGWCFRNLGREKKIWLMFHQSHLLMGLQPITVVDCPISEELQEMGLVTWKCWEPPQKAYWFVIMFLHQNGHYHIFETSKSWLQCEAPQWC